MEREYSKLQGLYLDSDQRKRELDLRTRIQANQVDLEALRAHLVGLNKREHEHKARARREHGPAGRLESQIEVVRGEIREQKRLFRGLDRAVRAEETDNLVQHQKITDLKR